MIHFCHFYILQFSYKNNVDCLCVCVSSSICLPLSVFPGAVSVCVCASDTISSLSSSLIWIGENVLIFFFRVREENAEPVNKSLLLLPTICCQVHTSSQHIIINCTLNYSVQLAMREWMERGRRRWNRWLHSHLFKNLIPITVMIIPAWFCIFSSVLCWSFRTCTLSVFIECSHLSMYCIFFEVISCIKIPLIPSVMF